MCPVGQAGGLEKSERKDTTQRQRDVLGTQNTRALGQTRPPPVLQGAASAAQRRDGKPTTPTTPSVQSASP